ncbi:MAG: TlpA family protein disulfide reductase [Candidatus Eisenbacteria bacterium]|nr:TlpA family protein disulfide reductase [Candidatus Eisenbacteria bacterium]
MPLNLARRGVCLALAWTLVAAAGHAQGAAPAAPATAPAPPPPSPVSGIRSKISAGDLLSAESILEVHRAKYGEDGPWLVGLSWLARGAQLLGEPLKTKRYISETRARCAERMARGAELAKDHDLEIALGAAIEVEAQSLQREAGAAQAARFVRGELDKVKGPVALRSRLNKRINMLTLAGSPAPELEIEDHPGERPPTLAGLRGQPVLLFLFAEGCGDCRAQAATLARSVSRYADRGLRVVALTRHYEETAQRDAETARVDSVWKTVYKDLGPVPVVISTASMERYGGSSTPTFVFVDREGVVRWYTPTRLDEVELDRALEGLCGEPGKGK